MIVSVTLLALLFICALAADGCMRWGRDKGVCK